MASIAPFYHWDGGGIICFLYRKRRETGSKIFILCYRNLHLLKSDRHGELPAISSCVKHARICERARACLRERGSERPQCGVRDRNVECSPQRPLKCKSRDDDNSHTFCCLCYKRQKDNYSERCAQVKRKTYRLPNGYYTAEIFY
jgi:hypothetical protein